MQVNELLGKRNELNQLKLHLLHRNSRMETMESTELWIEYQVRVVQDHNSLDCSPLFSLKPLNCNSICKTLFFINRISNFRVERLIIHFHFAHTEVLAILMHAF